MEKVIPFGLSEFIIVSDEKIELEIADKIWKYHIIPMVPVREELGLAIWPSQKSGYRPKWYELERGRSGNSEHCFVENGAVDWTCGDFKYKRFTLRDLIIKHTGYSRMAIYNGFIHCDYKATKSGRREVYISDSKSNWQFVEYAD